MVPYSVTAMITGYVIARLGLDASSPVVPSGDRPARAERMTTHDARIARAAQWLADIQAPHRC